MAHIGSSTTVTLLGTPVLTGNSITALDGTLYSQGIRTNPLGEASRIEITYGSGLGLYIGLTQGGQSPDSITHGLHVNISGELFAVSGIDLAFLGRALEGDTLAIHHDGVSVRMYRNGSRVATQEGQRGEWQALLLLNGTASGFYAASLQSVDENTLYNGEAETGDLAGWRNTSTDATASGALAVVSESCSGDFCFEMVKQGPGVCSMTSRAFPIVGRDMYNGFFSGRGDTPEGSIIMSLVSGNTLDEEGYLTGQVTVSDIATSNLGLEWTGGFGSTISQVHRFGAVQLRSSPNGTRRYLLDNITLLRAYPFVAAGRGTPEPYATVGGNLLINAALNRGQNGMLGLYYGEGAMRVKSSVIDKGEWHLRANALERVFFNSTHDDLFGLDDRTLNCAAYVQGAVSFHLECYDNAGSQIGQVETLLTSGNWGWQSSSITPVPNTTAMRISIIMTKNSRVALPSLMPRSRGAVDLMGEDAIRISDTNFVFEVGTLNESANLSVNGEDALRITSAQTEITNSLFVPSITGDRLDLSAIKNLSLSGTSIGFSVSDSSIATITPEGLSFNTMMGQMINLDGQQMGIGVQSDTMYIRTAKRFSVHAGGLHSPFENDAGGMGKTVFTVSRDEIEFNGRTLIPPRVLQGFVQGKLLENSSIWGVIAPYDLVLVPNHCVVRSTTNCTKQTVLEVTMDGIYIGSIRFVQGGNLGEFTLTGEPEIPAQGHLVVRSQFGADTELSDLTFLFSE